MTDTPDFAAFHASLVAWLAALGITDTGSLTWGGNATGLYVNLWSRSLSEVVAAGGQLSPWRVVEHGAIRNTTMKVGCVTIDAAQWAAELPETEPDSPNGAECAQLTE